VTTTHLYLTRHGETQWNVEHRLQGHHDSPLTVHGRRQVAHLRDALAAIAFDAIYSSSSPRALTTAEMLRADRPVDIVVSDALREIDFGSWEGRLLDEIEAEQPELHYAFWHRPDTYHPANGGESFDDVERRVVTCVEDLLRGQHGQTVFVVTHTVALKVLMSHFERRPIARLWDPPFIHPTSLCHVAVEAGIPTILQYGDSAHLPDLA
jgi:probable phosphoglycerate mutase